MSVNKPKHHATVMNFFGNPVPGCKLDLFREVKQMENCFLVDTNMPWETYSILPQYRNSAFIIGPTLLRERTLRDIFENKNGHKVRRNVYVFGMFPPAREDGILRLSLERVDENFHVFRSKNDIYYNKPAYRLEDFSPEEVRKAEAQKILSFLEAGSVSDLKNYELRVNAKHRLLSKVALEAKACFRDYYKCVKVAEMAYAVLLTEERTALNEFERLKPNIFNDAELIHNALFFGATLLSANQKHVGKMAEYCGLAFRQELG